MKKKLLSIALALTMAFGASACTTDDENKESAAEAVTVRVGSLSGPTTIGLLNLMDASENGNSEGTYEFTMATDPQEIAASINSGDLDIALIPANLAATLYNKAGNVKVIDINTLGVICCVTGDKNITSVKDLAGKTVVTTGQGATPEAALNYLLAQNGVTDCTLDFRSEGTEVVSVIANDPTQIAVLPQPAATSALMQNEDLSIAFTLTDEWDSLDNGSEMVTGVTVVRSDFLSEHPDAVKTFLKEHNDSASKANSDVDKTAALTVSAGIVPKEPVAKKAIPYCSIVCITGDDMKASLSGYLDVLMEQNPKLIGGAVPGEDFYYLG